MTRKAALCALALLQGSAAFAAAPGYFLSPPPHPAALEQTTPARIAEILIAQGIAAQRAHFAPDAQVLADDAALTQIARGRSDEMADGAPFSHQDDSGAYPAEDRVRVQFGRYGAIGENIMEETGVSHFDPAAFARSAVAGWMASPGHRENILSPDFRSSGIGVTVKGGAVFATQVFFGPPPD
jgi:uncharacterized protein YkwD